jgi:hypothetical protein
VGNAQDTESMQRVCTSCLLLVNIPGKTGKDYPILPF